jgi:hypothetical protein
MPVNNWGTNLRVETVVGNGEIKDNEEWLAEKNQLEHQQNPTEPWHKGYVSSEQLKAAVDELYEEFSHPVEADPALLEAHKQDLKIRNLNR